MRRQVINLYTWCHQDYKVATGQIVFYIEVNQILPLTVGLLVHVHVFPHIACSNVGKNKQNFKQLWVLRCGHSHDEYQMYIWQAASSNQANCSYCFSELCPGTLEWSGQCQWNHAPENHTATNCHWLGLQYLLEDTSTLLMKPCPTTCTHLDQNSNVLNWHPPKLNHQSPALTLTLTTLEALLGLIIKVFSHLCRNLSAP